MIRYADETHGFFIDDSEANLVEVESLPADPRDVSSCGGTEPPAIPAVKEVGLLRDIIHRHVSGDDVPVHAYALTGFDGDALRLIYTGTPIAAGTGRLMVAENPHSAGNQLQGTLTDLATGRPVRLTAFWQVGRSA